MCGVVGLYFKTSVLFIYNEKRLSIKLVFYGEGEENTLEHLYPAKKNTKYNKTRKPIHIFYRLVFYTRRCYLDRL